MRIGPFETRGGYSWNGLIVRTSESFWKHEREVWYDAFALGSLDGTSRVVGYPPIHQHHYHMTGDVPFGSVVMDMMGSIHPDDQCKADEGGTSCLVHGVPAGFAYRHTLPIVVSTEFNDVRRAGADPLHTWVFWAIRRCGRVPASRRLRGVHTFASTSTDSDRLTFRVETTSEGIMWNDGVLPPMMHVVEAYLHTHRSVTYDMHLYMGSVGQVFLSPLTWRDAHRAVMYDSGIVERATHDVDARRVRPHSARLACRYNQGLERIPFEGQMTSFDRRVNCDIGPSRLNRSWTLVSYFAGNDASPLPYVTMHAGLRVYFTMYDHDVASFATRVDDRVGYAVLDDGSIFE